MKFNKLIGLFLSISIASVALVLFCCIFIGCKRSESEGRAVTNDYCYVIAKIDGHDYIIGGLIGKYGTGLTHSESCSCKKGIK